jgi:3-methylfumaryl-CoA hydratase
MWAAGTVEFIEPLEVERPLTRRSIVSGCTPKTGRSGEMLFVTIEHAIIGDGRLHLNERQTIVYREAMRKDAPALDATVAATECDAERAFTPDTRHLFRFSALTFNTHRIHFDLPYATEVEGYPGLVVQGPFVATLLMDLLRRTWPQAVPLSFRFRAISPVFVGEELVLRARQTQDNGVDLWAANNRNTLAMEAHATLACT